MQAIGLITEGITDQAILERILTGCLGDVDVNPLRPLRDSTDTARVRDGEFSNWELVFEYCRSPAFAAALQFNDAIVVQVDTDLGDHPNFGVPLTIGGQLRPIQDIVTQTVLKLSALIDPQVRLQFGHRILYAVPVLSTECWLCALHECPGGRRTHSCDDHLRRRLAAKGVRYEKSYKAYKAISKDFRKRAHVDRVTAVSTCFASFVARIDAYTAAP